MRIPFGFFAVLGMFTDALVGPEPPDPKPVPVHAVSEMDYAAAYGIAARDGKRIYLVVEPIEPELKSWIAGHCKTKGYVLAVEHAPSVRGPGVYFFEAPMKAATSRSEIIDVGSPWVQPPVYGGGFIGGGCPNGQCGRR